MTMKTLIFSFLLALQFDVSSCFSNQISVSNANSITLKQSFSPLFKATSEQKNESTYSLSNFQKSHSLLRASEDENTGESEELSLVESVAAGSGLVAVPVVLYSEYVLKTTGSGLPAGPFGLVGALEGVSYLVILGIAGLSILTKTQTGSGLKAGPFGILGAVEGMTYLAILGGIVVFALNSL
mmetsp:Transcript_33001/g.43441  ORF Transcript_33001/g.43441 Transcript_33001/m.43441 type:complete len:183 (-) Transcript_33001:245-793(-)